MSTLHPIFAKALAPYTPKAQPEAAAALDQALADLAPVIERANYALSCVLRSTYIVALTEQLKQGKRPHMQEIADLLYQLEGVVCQADGYDAVYGKAEALADEITAIAREADGVEP